MREDQPSPFFMSAREAAIDEQLAYDCDSEEPEADDYYQEYGDDWDGQPDEAQEWESFDPDC